MPKTHLIFATDFEAKPLIKDLKAVPNNSGLNYYETSKFNILISGVGLITSAATSRAYFESSVSTGDRVINCGIAGAINTELSLYGVYEISSIDLYDPRSFAEPNDQRFNFYKAQHPNLNLGKSKGLDLASSLYPIWLSEDRELLREAKMDLVDMEAYSIAQVAKSFDCDFSILKSVSDFTAKESERSFLDNAQKAIESLIENLLEKLNLPQAKA